MIDCRGLDLYHHLASATGQHFLFQDKQKKSTQ
jgi:hypothetical protein